MTTTKLLTVPQAAAELGISPRRVHQLIQDQHLRAVRLGRGWFISPGQLERVRVRPGAGRPRKALSLPV